MAKNFMEAATEVEEFIDKKGKCLSNIGTIITEAVIARAGSGKVNPAMKSDIMKLIASLPKEDQIDVLSDVVMKMATNMSGGSRDKKSSPNTLFGGRF